MPRSSIPAPPRRQPLLAAVLCCLATTQTGAQFPGRKNYTFGNPAVSPCRPSEVNMTIKGVPGIFCSPPCSASLACPSLNDSVNKDAPPGVNKPAPPAQLRPVQADCAIEQKAGTKPTYCAMVCDPTSIMPRGGCPGGALHPNYAATCERVETIGMCMYKSAAGEAAGAAAAELIAELGLAAVEGALSASRGELGGVGKR